MPWLDRVLGKNPYCPIKFATFEHAALYSYEQFERRVSGEDSKSRNDFLDNFLEAKEQHPDIVGNNEVVNYLMMNVGGRLFDACVAIHFIWILMACPRFSQARTRPPSC